MKISKVAVGIDFSPLSERAAKEALGLARRMGADLTLIHVAPVPDPLPNRNSGELAGAGAYRDILLKRLAAARENLGQLRQRLSGQGVEVSTSVIDSNFPDHSLCTAAAELKANLLVVGTAGRTGLSHFLVGSTAEGTVRRAQMPTLVARATYEPLGHYHTILVPTDFSPAATCAFEFAVQMADKEAQIDLFHTIDDDALPIELADELAAVAHERAHNLFSQQTRQDVRFRFLTETAPAKKAILERANGYDLIAMGSHGRRGFAHLFLGSIAEYTVRHAPCSVVTVHAVEH